jgi:hypothetical protein
MHFVTLDIPFQNALRLSRYMRQGNGRGRVTYSSWVLFDV